MPSLDSSNLSSCEWNEQTGEMTVTFKSGQSYAYANVDRATYEGLVDAESPGKFFAQRVRDQFQTRKI